MERLPALPQQELPGLKTDARAATIGPVPWPAGDMGEDEKEVLMFRPAVTRTDWGTVERHGGFDAVMEKVVQWEQETPASNGRERIDEFHLRGSGTWRRMGEYSTETRLFIRVVHALDNHNASLSEGGALAVVVEEFPETPHQTRDKTDFPRLMRQAKRGLRLARPPLARRGGAPHERGVGGGSDPHVSAADAPRGRGRLFRPLFIPCPCPWGSLPPP